MDNKAEEEFKIWLDKNNIPYWYIDQSLESFSPALRRFWSKRPDFMILIPNVGFIFVDVKDKSAAEKYPKFFIDADDVDKYSSMQSIFNIKTWIVISNKNYHYQTWFWMPVSGITKSGFINKSSVSGEDYYSVPSEEFVTVSPSDNLERIFSKLLKL